MKKCATVCLVFACIFSLVGLAFMAGSLCTMQYQQFYGNHFMISMGSGYGMVTGMQVMRMIFSAALFLGGILLLCLSAFLYSRPVEVKEVKKAEQPVVEAKAEEVKAEQPVCESHTEDVKGEPEA